jgi:hypothetical protein
MKEKLKQVKEHIKNHKSMSEEEKLNSVKKIDEWFLEDKADGTIVAELIQISKNITPILEEIGLL